MITPKDKEKLDIALRWLKEKHHKNVNSKKQKHEPIYDDVYHEGVKWLDTL